MLSNRDILETHTIKMFITPNDALNQLFQLGRWQIQNILPFWLDDDCPTFRLSYLERHGDFIGLSPRYIEFQMLFYELFKTRRFQLDGQHIQTHRDPANAGSYEVISRDIFMLLQNVLMGLHFCFSRILAAALLLVTVPCAARADVTDVSSSPARVSIPAKGPATLSVTWPVVVNGGAGGGTFNVTSVEAALRINGARVEALAGSLSRTVTLAAGEVRTLSFTETYTISPALARRISREDAGSVTIRRLFTDGAGTAFHEIPVAAGNQGDLSVRRIELKFENDARTDIVRKGDVLRAVADVSFRSNGLLRGEWRIVDPSASLGGSSTGRRVLQVVRQQLVSSGEGRTRIVSPPLPTDVNGLYLLSFSVEDTDGTIEVPILRYFVLEGGESAAPTNMDILTPGDHASINEETLFSWNPLAGAQAYRVEILKAGDEMPVAAKLVPGTDLKLSLSALSFEDLVSGQFYEWRVRAFAGGKLIGQSERRSLKVQ